MKKLGLIVLNIILGVELIAQPLKHDSSFQPFFDIRSSLTGAGVIYDVVENPQSGRLYLAGEFDLGGTGVPLHGGLTKLNNDGSFDFTYAAAIQSGPIFSVHQINDTLIGLNGDRTLGVFDTLGNNTIQGFNGNYYQTVRCIFSGPNSYFYEDGSALVPNSLGSVNGCPIYSYNDTFPHRFIVKINPQGFYDSSFQAFPNTKPQGFIPYDSNRLFVFDKNYAMSHFNGLQVDGLCRIYDDGSLDTTFHNPIDANRSPTGSWAVENVQEDGSFFIVGAYYIKNDTNKERFVAKFLPNGDLDSSFKWTSTLQNTRLSWAYGAGPIVNTFDGGYILSGAFTRFQGQAKNNLVKLDSNGLIEPQYFNSIGPDSSDNSSISNYPIIHGITRSELGGYYVYGDFLKWDGQPSQPIVRIFDENFGVGLPNRSEQNQIIDLYPNPANDKITVEVQNANELNEVIVYDLLGQEYDISSGFFRNRIDLNVSNLSEGVYILSITTEHGRSLEKFVVNKN